MSVQYGSQGWSKVLIPAGRLEKSTLTAFHWLFLLIPLEPTEKLIVSASHYGFS